MMRSRSSLLKAQHFAEDKARGRQLNPCVPVVYERRSNCKLKRSGTLRSRIRHAPGNAAADGFGSAGSEIRGVRDEIPGEFRGTAPAPSSWGYGTARRHHL